MDKLTLLYHIGEYGYSVLPTIHFWNIE